MSSEKLTAQVYVVSPNGPPRAKIVVVDLPGSDGKKRDLFFEGAGKTVDLLRLLSETVAILSLQMQGPQKLVDASIKGAIDLGFQLAQERRRQE